MEFSLKKITVLNYENSGLPELSLKQFRSSTSCMCVEYLTTLGLQINSIDPSKQSWPVFPNNAVDVGRTGRSCSGGMNATCWRSSCPHSQQEEESTSIECSHQSKG